MDLESLLNGKNSHPIVTLIMNLIVRIIEPPIKLPIQKGSYKLPKFTLPVLPFARKDPFKFLVDIKLHMKKSRQRRTILVSKVLIKGSTK